MNELSLKNSVMKIKDETDLPPHITYDEYQSLINEVINNLYNHYLNN